MGVIGKKKGTGTMSEKAVETLWSVFIAAFAFTVIKGERTGPSIEKVRRESDNKSV